MNGDVCVVLHREIKCMLCKKGPDALIIHTWLLVWHTRCKDELETLKQRGRLVLPRPRRRHWTILKLHQEEKLASGHHHEETHRTEGFVLQTRA